MILDPVLLVVPWEWEAPMWWNFLPALQVPQEPGFMQWTDYSRFESLLRADSLHQALSLIEEDTKKQVLVTCTLFLTSCLVWVICARRLWNKNPSIPSLSEEQKQVEYTNKQMKPTSEDNPQTTHFPVTESGISDETTRTSERAGHRFRITRPIDRRLQRRRYLFPARNLVDALKKDRAKIEKYHVRFHDCPPQDDPEQKVILAKEHVVEKETHIEKHSMSLRKSELFSRLCNFWEGSGPHRLWSGIAEMFGGGDEESWEPRPRYMKVWYAPERTCRRHRK